MKKMGQMRPLFFGSRLEDWKARFLILKKWRPRVKKRAAIEMCHCFCSNKDIVDIVGQLILHCQWHRKSQISQNCPLKSHSLWTYTDAKTGILALGSRKLEPPSVSPWPKYNGPEWVSSSSKGAIIFLPQRWAWQLSKISNFIANQQSPLWSTWDHGFKSQDKHWHTASRIFGGGPWIVNGHRPLIISPEAICWGLSSHGWSEKKSRPLISMG